MVALPRHPYRPERHYGTIGHVKRVAEWAIVPVEGEIPARLRVVIVDEDDQKHEFVMPPVQAHRLSDDLLRGVAKVVPRTGTG